MPHELHLSRISCNLKWYQWGSVSIGDNDRYLAFWEGLKASWAGLSPNWEGLEVNPEAFQVGWEDLGGPWAMALRSQLGGTRS